MKLDTRQVKAKQGLQWIMSGFYLFRQSPAAWIIVVFTMVLIATTLALVPLLGTFLFTLISPVFLAGIMQGCRNQEQGQRMALAHLFIAFKKQAIPLITIGGTYLIGQVLIIGIARLIGGSEASDLLLYGKRVDDSQIMYVADNLLSALLAVVTLSIPLMMAVWFSPMLVFFHNVPPIPAMQKSFFACLMNFIPFQVYGIVLIILTIIAAVPWGLGLVILVPTIFASIYVSYKDIFLAEPLVIQGNTSEDLTQANWSESPDTSSNEQNTDIEEAPKKEPANSNTDQKMVQCGYCGTHLQAQDAIKADEQYYCSDEHAKQHHPK